MSITTTTGNSNASEQPHPLIQKALHSTVPIAELIGFHVDGVATGRGVASLRSGPQHANPMGTLHGGVLCDLADAAMSMAFVIAGSGRQTRRKGGFDVCRVAG